MKLHGIRIEVSSLQAKSSLFSVVVTCYNQEKLIEECLESVKEQSYDSLELIICDDKSSDGSVETIRKWIEKNSKRFDNVELIVNKRNLGIAGNHNAGLKKASGKFVTFIHGDDKLHSKDSIAHITAFLKEQNLKFCACRIKAFLDNGDGKYIDLQVSPSEERMPLFNLTPKKQFPLLCKGNFAPGVMVFETSFLNELGGFDEEMRINEDWAIWLKLSRLGYQIRCSSEPFLLYRKHSQAITVSAMNEGKKDFFEYQLRVVEKYVFPNLKVLNLLDRWSVRINVMYTRKLIELGCNHNAHRKARLLKLLDPFSLFKAKLSSNDRTDT